MLERRGGPFIAPQEGLAVGVSETRTCPGRGLDMFDQPPDMFGPGLSC
jgi:hypothetical protein